MKTDKIFIILALALALGFPLIMTAYVYFTVGGVNTHYALPRLVALSVLSVLVYRGINWARWLLVGISLVVILGVTASVIMHFYAHRPGSPSLLLFVQLAVYLVASLLLTLPKPVQNLYRKTGKN